MRSFGAAAVVLCTCVVTFSKSETHPKLVPTIRLNSGYDIPVLGLGTSQAKAKECEQAVKNAIDSGCRHIDSAYMYGNEKEVGNAVLAKIADGVIKREDVFITTKLWNTFHDPKEVPRAFQKSFDNLNLTYIDLYLLHMAIAYAIVNKNGSKTDPTDIDGVELFPILDNAKTNTIDIDYVDTWHAMEQLVNSGRIRSLGVSNFNSEQIDRLLLSAKIKPVTNQVECHPNFNQLKLLKFCAERNITLTAYSPLGRPHVGGNNLAINDPKVTAIAAAHNKSPGQIVLRYTYQNGIIVIPKSTNKERIKNNIDIFDFQLSDSDMEIIDGLNTNIRLLANIQANHDKHYPFNIEF